MAKLSAVTGRLFMLAALALPLALHAQTRPSKPIRLILPFPPSGGTDTLGRVRPLALLSETRGSVFAELPTAAEAGFPQVTNDTWYGVFVPAATPREIVMRLNQELHRTLANPEFVKRRDAVGVETRTSTPEELGRFVRSESARFGKVIRSAGIKPI